MKGPSAVVLWAPVLLGLALVGACGGGGSGKAEDGAVDAAPDAAPDGTAPDATAGDGSVPGTDAGADPFADGGGPPPYACDDDTRVVGTPLTLTPEKERQWTFVPIDGMRCRDGSSTGIGVNWSSTSKNVVVFLAGGNACFDKVTCNPVITPDHFDGTNLATQVLYLDYGFLDRWEPDNALRDWSYVYVPYCTGDVHAGTKTEAGFLGNLFHGYANMTRVLERVVPTFPDAEHVLLGGASAGGFGALLNYDRTQRAFGCTPVDLLDDSGAPLNDAVLRPCLQERVRGMWGLGEALPTDCQSCTTENGGGLGNLAPFLALKYPERRMALLSALQDGVIRQFFGYGTQGCKEGGVKDALALGTVPGADYQEGLETLRDRTVASYGNFRVFYAPSSAHVLGGNVNFAYAMPAIHAWVRLMVTGDPTWSNVAVAP